MKNKLSLGVYGELFALDLEKVMYLEADDHYTIVYYSSGIHFMLPFGLSKVEEAISDEEIAGNIYLLRFCRKYIVNINYIYHVNVMKQIIQLYDNRGDSHSLHIPKPILRNLLEKMKNESVKDS